MLSDKSKDILLAAFYSEATKKGIINTWVPSCGYKIHDIDSQEYHKPIRILRCERKYFLILTNTDERKNIPDIVFKELELESKEYEDIGFIKHMFMYDKGNHTRILFIVFFRIGKIHSKIFGFRIRYGKEIEVKKFFSFSFHKDSALPYGHDLYINGQFLNFGSEEFFIICFGLTYEDVYYIIFNMRKKMCFMFKINFFRCNKISISVQMSHRHSY